LRKGPASQPQQSTPQAPPSTRRALKEKTNTVHSQAPRYENDGDTEGLVKDARPGKGKRRLKKAQQKSDDLVMAGGLANSDEAQAQLPSEPPTTTDELAKSDDGLISKPKGNRRPPRTVRKIAQSQAQSKVLEGLKQRMEATARGQRTKPTVAPAASDAVVHPSEPKVAVSKIAEATDPAVERSGLSLSPSPPRETRLSVARVKRSSMMQPGSVLKAQSTPAVEHSFLALKNFKRRPRQMSMLSMVQQRTASARPSLVQDSLALEDSSAFDFELDGDEEDDFAPEAEGTPLHAEKGRRTSAAARKRKSTGVGHTPASQSSLRSKRRKSSTEGNDMEKTLDDAPLSSPGDTIQVRPYITDPVENARSSPVSSAPRFTPPIPASTGVGDEAEDIEVPSTNPETRAVERAASVQLVEESDADIPNGTMAEPASSSPAPIARVQVHQDLADPATQTSPAASRPKRAKKQKPVSTATLQSLLPKRRKALKPRQKKTEYDMESESEEEITLDASNLDDDEDELGGGLRRRTQSTAAKTRKSAAAKKTPKAQTAVKSTARGKRMASVAASATAGSKTCGRATASDKENDGDESFEEADESTLPEVSVSMQELAKSQELEEAKRKFAEVDDWDMDFESMSQDEHRRSSQSWR
jgi:hypothetical protein